MNLEELFWQAWWGLQQLWASITYEVRDHPLIVLGAAVILVIVWRFLAPGRR